jgi:hypothetical protein
VDQPDHESSKIDVKKRFIAKIRVIHLLHTQCFTSDSSVHMMQPRVFSVQCLAILPILTHGLERDNVRNRKVIALYQTANLDRKIAEVRCFVLVLDDGRSGMDFSVHL